MRLTENFTLSEFDCNDGSITPPEAIDNLKTLAKNLQVLRDYFGLPISINSGYRSPSHNKKVGGAKNSQHLLGKAADIVVRGRSPEQVYKAILELVRQGKMHNGGIGKYRSFLHYDIRDYPARW